jgi:hypothetical protein
LKLAGKDRKIDEIAALHWERIVRLKRIVLAIGFLTICNFAVSAQVEVSVPDVGLVKTDAKAAGGTVAVTTQFIRGKATARSCSGTCFYQTNMRTITWTCSDNKACQLDCAGAAPKGTC